MWTSTQDWSWKRWPACRRWLTTKHSPGPVCPVQVHYPQSLTRSSVLNVPELRERLEESLLASLHQPLLLADDSELRAAQAALLVSLACRGMPLPSAQLLLVAEALVTAHANAEEDEESVLAGLVQEHLGTLLSAARLAAPQALDGALRTLAQANPDARPLLERAAAQPRS